MIVHLLNTVDVCVNCTSSGEQSRFSTAASSHIFLCVSAFQYDKLIVAEEKCLIHEAYPKRLLNGPALRPD